MPDRNTFYEAGWTDNLRHNREPNRVDSLPAPRVAAAGRGPASGFDAPAAPAKFEMQPVHPPPQHQTNGQEEASYYDVSMLKKPVWKWQIASYFYLGGLSAGAYLLARVADRLGGLQHRDVTRAGTWISVLAVAPCPPLLIDDLGDPKRFHHMLRVFKPSSPMNLGTWTLVGYSGMVAAALLREALRDRGAAPEEQRGTRGVMLRVWLQVHDMAGIPLAVTVAGYTGVLLSCTSNPLWCKNPWLGPLFSASAISTGAEAVSLALDCMPAKDGSQARSQQALQRIDTAAHAAELICTQGFERFAGEKAKPLKQGRQAQIHKIALGALVASEVVKVLPMPRRLKKPARMLAAAAGLAAGFALRWSIVHGGKEAAEDPHAARLVSRPESRAKQTQGSLEAASGRLAHRQHPE